MQKALMFGGGIFSLAIALYVLVFGMSVLDSIFATITRVLFVPTATEANYFYAFPDILSFRGLIDSYIIRVFNPPGVSGVSIYDVAIAATGNEFSANASFLAVGWSGFGYLGVLLVSISLCFGLLVLDGMNLKRDKYTKQMVLAISLPPLLVLNSASFLDYVGAGGVVGGILLLLIVRD